MWFGVETYYETEYKQYVRVKHFHLDVKEPDNYIDALVTVEI